MSQLGADVQRAMRLIDRAAALRIRQEDWFYLFGQMCLQPQAHHSIVVWLETIERRSRDTENAPGSTT